MITIRGNRIGCGTWRNLDENSNQGKVEYQKHKVADVHACDDALKYLGILTHEK